MIEFRAEVSQIPSINDVFDAVYPTLSEMIDTEGAFAAAGVPVMVCPEAQTDADRFDEGRQFSFYIPHVTVRPVLVWREGQTMVVQARTLLGPMDFILALQLIKGMQSFGAVYVVTDDEPETKRGFDFIEREFTPQWYSRWAREAMRDMMVTCSRDANTIYKLSGPFNDFHFGSYLTGVMHGITDEEQRLSILHKMMRTMNYWPLEDETKHLTAAQVVESDDGSTVAFIGLGLPTVVGNADYFAFVKKKGLFNPQNEVVLTVRGFDFRERFPPGDRFELMDEFCIRVHVEEKDLKIFSDAAVVKIAVN